ncbi:hypothetical protein [Mammaliicoccus sp. E-M24]|uniref:hypothetical protein n=1 Tax=Mammaliicoccus sp. E-M24 TaxID=2898684 RepID=UPI001EFB3BE0|nr:hypothetical protein [Mammaliicoccus sp. E-M24]
MNICFNVTGSIAHITDDNREALKDLLHYSNAVIMLRGEQETLTINIEDIIDIGVLEKTIHATRALQILK